VKCLFSEYPKKLAYNTHTDVTQIVISELWVDRLDVDQSQ